MTFQEFFIIFMFGILPISIILLYLMLVGIEALKMNRYKKKFPYLFELIDKREKLDYEYCEFHNKEILPIRRKIDCILEKQKYMSMEKFEISKIILKELKLELESLEMKNYEKIVEIDLLKEKIEDIIKTDKSLLKTMKKLGWCKGVNNESNND